MARRSIAAANLSQSFSVTRFAKALSSSAVMGVNTYLQKNMNPEKNFMILLLKVLTPFLEKKCIVLKLFCFLFYLCLVFYDVTPVACEY